MVFIKQRKTKVKKLVLSRVVIGWHLLSQKSRLSVSYFRNSKLMLKNKNDSMRLLDKNAIVNKHLQPTNNSTRGHNQKILNFIVSIIAQSCC